MEKVFLAYYHDGFTDNNPVLLAVCDSKAVAERVISTHKQKRDRSIEYKEDASWWIRCYEVLTTDNEAQEQEFHNAIQS